MANSNIKKNQALQAIKTIKQLDAKFLEDPSRKKPLLEDETDHSLFLHITLKKIPLLQNFKMIKVPLPHSLIQDSTDICLITGDLDKKDYKAETDPTVQHYKELLKENDITNISEVLPLRELRTEYKTYESKRHLLHAYDVFLADNAIAGCLPRLLGKPFFKNRKFPIQINMKTRNLKQQVEKALSETVFYLSSHGNSCTSVIAHSHMDDKEILQNINAAANILSEKIIGGWDNILGIYIKTAKSKAIPVYMSFENPNDVVLKQVKQKEKVEAEELSTRPNVNIRVFKNGRVIIQKFKKKKPDNINIKHETQCSLKQQLNDECDSPDVEVKKNNREEDEDNSDEHGSELDEECILSSKKRREGKRNDVKENYKEEDKDNNKAEHGSESSKKSRKGKRDFNQVDEYNENSLPNVKKHVPERQLKVKEECRSPNTDELNESNNRQKNMSIKHGTEVDEKYSSSKKRQKRDRNSCQADEHDSENTLLCMKPHFSKWQLKESYGEDNSVEHGEKSLSCKKKQKHKRNASKVNEHDSEKTLPKMKRQNSISKISMNKNNDPCSNVDTNVSESKVIQSNDMSMGRTGKQKLQNKKASKKYSLLNKSDILSSEVKRETGGKLDKEKINASPQNYSFKMQQKKRKSAVF